MRTGAARGASCGTRVSSRMAVRKVRHNSIWFFNLLQTYDVLVAPLAYKIHPVVSGLQVELFAAFIFAESTLVAILGSCDTLGANRDGIIQAEGRDCTK